MPKLPPSAPENDPPSSSDDAENEHESEYDEGSAILVDEQDEEEDVVPSRKVEIDNTEALRRIRETIQLDPSLPWTETLVVTYPETIDVDVEDDLNRELAFYKQALYSAERARTLAEQHDLPFTRPADYFAEMVKSDAHMERIRTRLLDERAGIKKAEDNKKQREAKKFGKQVQIEKIKERERSKKAVAERLKSLKRKRKGGELGNADGEGGGEDFDVAVEEAISEAPAAKRTKLEGGRKMPRTARDAKYGFGGKDRRSKQNTKSSTDSFIFDPSKKGKGKGKGKGASKSKRPGRSKRVSMKSRR